MDYPLTPTKSDKQFKRAQELKVGYSAKLKENDLYVRIRNFKTRDEVVAGFGDVANHLELDPVGRESVEAWLKEVKD